MMMKGKKGSAFSCFCNKKATGGIFTKPKKADEKYYIIISLILGIIVIGLSIYFIFNEYFTQDEINYETCRQSIILRSNIPDITDYDFADLKEKFPLKCQTQVVEVNSINQTEVLKQIEGAVRQCYYLYGENNLKLYGTNIIDDTESICNICARIHFNNEIVSKLGRMNVGTYLVNNKVPGLLMSTYTFDSKDGDILVTYVYLKGTLVGDDFRQHITLFQPGVNIKRLAACTYIETIPA